MALDQRIAGVLAHPSSLPGKLGIGDLGPVAHEFIDWAHQSGFGMWQVLPLGPTGLGNSPYGALSAFAGNPILISPEALIADGLLPAAAIRDPPSGDPSRVTFDRVAKWKSKLLKQSFRRFLSTRPKPLVEAFDRFRADPFHSGWLQDWGLFAALRQRSGGLQWNSWDEGLRHRTQASLNAAATELKDAIDLAIFTQFLFFRQWEAIRGHAQAKAITIVGDMPIYVAYDSVDVWANQNLFQLDKHGRSTRVAGVPPDYFSETGQRWGNPLYRWDRMREDNYVWWFNRMRANLLLTDIVRLDHFRAFAGYWAIPVEEETAVKGEWVPGPGADFFDRLREKLGRLPLIAEDLGLITPDVIALRDHTGLPGMRVLQFGFGNDDNEHLPHRFEKNLVVYTGTHDNDTSRGWFETASEEERRRTVAYLGEESSVVWQLIRAALTSVAAIAIIPLQDIFSLGSEGRMNTPGKPENNWNWRATAEQFAAAPRERLRRLIEITGRLVRR